MTTSPLDPSTPAKHDAVDLEQIWTLASVAKFIVGLIFALIAAVVTAVHAPITISGVLQVVVVALAAAGVYLAPYSSRAFASAKLWTAGLAAVLTAVVPFVATYIDTGAWHNLTAVQWLVVILAVGKAVGIYVVPNAPVLEVPSFSRTAALAATHSD